MKKEYNDLYMRWADNIAKCSKANRKKVGAVFVLPDHAIACGYNGTPPGWDNACEDETNTTKPSVIHAEMNAIFHAAKAGQSLKGAKVFCTHSPCYNCAIAMISVGIVSLTYREDYGNASGIDVLREEGINVKKWVDSKPQELEHRGNDLALLSKDLCNNLKEVFSYYDDQAQGSETNDVINYVESWLSVYTEKNDGKA